MSRGLGFVAELASVSHAACGPRAHIPLVACLSSRRLEPADSAGAPGARRLPPPCYTSSATSGSRSSASSPSSIPPVRSLPTICSGATTSTDPGCRFTVPTDEEVVWVGARLDAAPRPTFGRSGMARCSHADLARPWPGRDRHPMGKARIASPSRRSRVICLDREAESVLRLYLIGLPDICSAISRSVVHGASVADTRGIATTRDSCRSLIASTSWSRRRTRPTPSSRCSVVPTRKHVRGRRRRGPH